MTAAGYTVVGDGEYACGDLGRDERRETTRPAARE
jgi:hypothetical protein